MTYVHIDYIDKDYSMENPGNSGKFRNTADTTLNRLVVIGLQKRTRRRNRIKHRASYQETEIPDCVTNS